jgi:hypothetical protein
MAWEDQGRQDYGWFGNGTSAKDKQTGASGDGGAPGGLADRIQAVIHGAAAALPRQLRYHPAARLDAKTLDRLTSVDDRPGPRRRDGYGKLRGALLRPRGRRSDCREIVGFRDAGRPGAKPC